jgi:hypothetical protein
MTGALEGGEWSAARPNRTLPPGKTRYPYYTRLGGPQGRSGQVRKITPPTGIRSLDRPARSQSLYRLSYPAHSFLSTVAKLRKATMSFVMSVRPSVRVELGSHWIDINET